MNEIRRELLDELLAQYERPEDLTGPDGILKQLTKRLIEAAAGAELTDHLGYEVGDPAGRGTGNSRNGTTPKSLVSEAGRIELDMPRDRAGTFEPQIMPKGDTHWSGFDDRIISMYARGMTQSEIQGHLHEMYQVQVSKDLISRVTDKVLEDIRAWQSRPLDPCYPIIWLDGLVVKVRTDGTVQNRVMYIVLGVNLEGRKEVLALCLGGGGESAKFWLKVLTELRQRGVRQVCIACCDGLGGFPEAIESVFAETWVQCCVVHLIRNSLKFVSYKDRKTVAADLKPIYRAASRDAAELALESFAEKWDRRYPMIAEQWRANWERFCPFLEFPEDVRRVIYTTNSIEALNRQIRKIIKTRGHFPSDDAAIKLIGLALQQAEKKW
ncbi:MAG: IS256 family transposase, partial [Solirubrobacteraceae bacterium]